MEALTAVSGAGVLTGAEVGAAVPMLGGAVVGAAVGAVTPVWPAGKPIATTSSIIKKRPVPGSRTVTNVPSSPQLTT
eukprot:3180569-Prymnesium_polylepis.1